MPAAGGLQIESFSCLVCVLRMIVQELSESIFSISTKCVLFLAEIQGGGGVLAFLPPFPTLPEWLQKKIGCRVREYEEGWMGGIVGTPM